jgi:glucosamine-phosphate N-acetyltransferase
MIREARKEDLPGIISCLSFLSTAPFSSFEEIYSVERAFEERSICGNIFTFVRVCEYTGDILGTLTVVSERKLSHGGGLTCSIQDVAVNKLYNSVGVGTELVKFAVDFAKSLGAYKVVLQCNDALLSFYDRFGFFKTGNEMRINLA